MVRGPRTSRRAFLRNSALGLAGGLLGLSSARAEQGRPLSPVALTAGPDRRENLLRALELVKREVLRAAHGRRILLKPNMVVFNQQFGADVAVALSASHVEQVEIVADWFRHLGFRDIVVAESTPNGMTFDGFEALGYTPLARRLPVVFRDLNQEGYRLVNINGSSPDVRVSRLLLDEGYYVVSLAKLKTHNNAVATFSGKNVFMASPVIDVKNFRGAGGRSDKGRMHGARNQDLHDNLFLLAYRGVRPDLAVIDGHEGMEGRGPIWGTAVPSHVAVASPDWLAADRICCELIGIEDALKAMRLAPELPAYLRYCAQAGMGAFALEDIELRGEALDGLCRTYQMHPSVAGMIGMDPLAPIFRTGPTAINPSDADAAPPLRL